MGHGLRYPADLRAWRRWHESRHPVRWGARAARARLRRPAAASVDLWVPPDGGADLLVAVEATHTSVAHAVAAPLAHLAPERTAVVAPVGWGPPETLAAHHRRTATLGTWPGLTDVRAVLAAGDYTEIGAAAFAFAEAQDATFFVSQHGALTPHAPPLPRAAHLLTWSDEDGDFWTTGRSDVATTTVGSQLLWIAGRRRPDPVAARPASEQLVYLGQGHAAEISRSRLTRAALATCREHGAVYRPHPSERDVVSRSALMMLRRAGVTVDTRGMPLVELSAPIVGVFSTGVLEAAAQGREAWVDFPGPPAWLGEFWERYGMHRLGSSPTPAPDPTGEEPARRIGEIVEATP